MTPVAIHKVCPGLPLHANAPMIAKIMPMHKMSGALNDKIVIPPDASPPLGDFEFISSTHVIIATAMG